MSSRSYDDLIRQQARGISWGIVKDMDRMGSLDEHSEELEEMELELRESVDWLNFWRDDAGIHYWWGLAGNGVGHCNIRMTGLVDIKGDHDIQTAILQCVQDREWVEVCKENQAAHYEMALAAMGSLYFDVEEFLGEERDAGERQERGES